MINKFEQATITNTIDTTLRIDVALSSILFVLIIRKVPIPNNIANTGRSILLLPKSISLVLA